MATITENQGDASADTGTRYTLAVGNTFQGTLFNVSDVDWIRVELDADTNYDIVLNGEIPLEFDIFDSAGTYVVSGYQRNAGTMLTGNPNSTGTYFIAVKSSNDNTAGEYELSLDEHLITTGSYDEIADYLVNGAWEWYGEPGFAFDIEPGGAIYVNITALTLAGQQLARWALEAWAGATGIRFEFVAHDSAHIIFDDDEEGAFVDFTRSGGAVIASTVNISTDWLEQYATEIGSYSQFVYLHEIGHALGLGHAGPYDEGGKYEVDNIFLLDSWQTTVQSYFTQIDNTHINASYAVPVTPMIADIIAIQSLYGNPDDINAGDTVYGYRSNLDGYLGQVFKLLTGVDDPFAGISVPDPSGKLSLVDLDDDGDFDIVIGNREGTFHYFENTGSTTEPDFRQRTDSNNPLAGLDTGHQSTPEFADLDGDGDYDLIAGSSAGEISYFENTGTVTSPGFTHHTVASNPVDNAEVGDYSIPELADLDGDGDIDLIVGSRDSIPHYFENTGTQASPNFTHRTGEDNPFEGINPGGDSGLALTDIDGDGDLDLVLWTWYDNLYYFENTGTVSEPVFTERSDAASPLQLPDDEGLRMPEFIDLDNDNDLDIVFGVHEGAIQHLENTGTRVEPNFVSTSFDQAVALTLNDNGGNDTLDLRTDHQDQRVDLSPEGISDVYGLVGNLVIARGTVIENFIAGSGNDVVTGNTAGNNLEGRIGNDILDGLAGDDILNGNDGDDTLNGGPGADTLDGGPGSDTASYQNSAAAVLVRLHDASAVRNGDAAGDTLTGIEHLVGSRHNDILAGDGGDNRLEGGDGNDDLYGGPAGGDDMMYGGNGDDRVFGGRGNDTLTGGAGSDILKGGPGDDIIIVDGDDIDILYGGPDKDTFRFFPSDVGGGSIRDFSDGEDVIDLTEFAGINSMADLDIVSHGDNVRIAVSGTDYLTTIILSDFDVNNLDNSDFLF